MIKKEIQYIMSNEKVVNKALQVSLGEMNATIGINRFLESLGLSIHCDRIYIFEGLRDMSVDNTYEWCAEGVSSEKDSLQQVPFEVVAWWYDLFETNNHLIIENIEDLKEKEPLTYEYLKPQNVTSLVAAPLKKGSEILGFFGVDNPPEEALHSITYIVEIVSHFLVSLLEKKRLMDKLERLSYKDHLTGVSNRHALNEYLEEHRVLKNTGIVYCDVLGLKHINDTWGHYAGDELLIRASKCLRSTFRLNDIYRIGGDEFLIICNNIEETIFLKRVEELRGKMEDYKAKMSLGVLWRQLISNPEQALAEADALMYEEKRNYYALNGKEKMEDKK